jgi:hypothetical protein
MSAARDIAELARALGAKRSGRQWLCRCPAHDDHNPSLIFWQGHSAIRFKCYSGCDPLDIIAALRRRGLLERHGECVRDRNISGRHQNGDGRKREDEELARKHTELAREIWHAARDPRGTLVEDYLRSRHLVLADELVGRVLRFHPRCPWRNKDTGKTEYLPALIAAFRSIDDDTLTAIHRIRLDQPERWPKAQRRMLGVVHRAAVKLDSNVSDVLVIGEGVETCMAAHQLMAMGELERAAVWALGSAGGIERFPVLPNINTLRILAENDDGTNKKAREQCGRRWLRAGRRVRVIKPDIDLKDLNDVLRGETHG